MEGKKSTDGVDIAGLRDRMLIAVDLAAQGAAELD